MEENERLVLSKCYFNNCVIIIVIIDITCIISLNPYRIWVGNLSLIKQIENKVLRDLSDLPRVKGLAIDLTWKYFALSQTVFGQSG